jgi:predicted RND superfamily exporter protein
VVCLARGGDRTVTFVDPIAAAVTARSKSVVAILLVLTVVVGYGATMIPPAAPQNSGNLVEETPELVALEYLTETYASDDEGVSTVQVFVRDDDSVLTKTSLLASLRYQQAVYADRTASAPLVTDRTPIVGIENVVATTLMGVSEPTLQAQADAASLADQVAALEAASDAEVADTVEFVLSGRPDAPAGGQALALVPVDYTPGDTTANARAMVVARDIGDTAPGDQFPEPVLEGETAMAELAEEQADAEYFLTTFTVLAAEDTVAMTDSLTIVGPLALLLIVVALAVAYRDLLDITLGLVGTFVTLVWAFGLMGWAGIPGDTFVVLVVPILLIGLSVDYAIHTFMRLREARTTEGVDTRTAMRASLAGVGVALVWVTVTAGVGFLSNLTSDFELLRNFGIATTLGLLAALVVFTTLIPALKIELDGIFARFSRRESPKRAFGTGGGRLSRLLASGTVAARRAPTAVIAVALVTAGVGLYGGSQLDATIDESGLADQPPAWMYSLPEPFRPAEYTAKEKLDFVNEHFRRGDDVTTYVLVQGDVTADDTLERLAAGEAAAADADAVLVSADGDAATTSPLTLVRAVSAVDPELQALVADADPDGDGVPDRDLAAIYDRLYAVAPEQSAAVLERTSAGDYRSLVFAVDTRGDADYVDATRDTRAVAAAIAGDDEALTVTPTGERVIVAMTVRTLIDSVTVTLLVTLGVVVAILAVGYRLTEGSGSLGVVTLLPVAFAVSWFFGTLWLFDVKFDILTSVIAALTVGLGVDYSIHVSERYKQELARQDTVWDAMDATLTGTGGALVGGFSTTVAAFGTLVLATVPQLQQFGVLIGIALVFAFGSSLLLLPSLLVLWTRYLGPSDVRFDDADPGVVAVGADD